MPPKQTKTTTKSDASESSAPSTSSVSAPVVSVTSVSASEQVKPKAVKAPKTATTAAVVAATTVSATTTETKTELKTETKTELKTEPKTEPKVKAVKAPKAAKVETVAVKSETDASSVAVDDAAIGDIEASIAAQSVEFLTKLNQLSSMVATLKTEYRNLEKKWSRELKAAQKTSSKKRKRTGNRAPSGFVKPTRISDELASFLGKDKGTEMARTDVTREINLYIRSHDLQDKANGRKINPDSKLQSLLKLKTTDELTYFNLQRFMSPHFQKAADAAAAAAASV
jgi:upstream activation factor subunit UAF30